MSTEFIKRASARIKKNSEIAEVDIEDAFCKYAASKNCRAEKIGHLHKRGFLDRTVFCPGGFVLFIEFKKPGKINNVSAGQMKTINMLRGLGFEAHICDNLQVAKDVLDSFLFRCGVAG